MKKRCKISGMSFLPGEPLLVTSSGDNSLKMWIFDMADGGAREHKSRTGNIQGSQDIRQWPIN